MDGSALGYLLFTLSALVGVPLLRNVIQRRLLRRRMRQFYAALDQQPTDLSRALSLIRRMQRHLSASSIRELVGLASFQAGRFRQSLPYLEQIDGVDGLLLQGVARFRLGERGQARMLFLEVLAQADPASVQGRAAAHLLAACQGENRAEVGSGGAL